MLDIIGRKNIFLSVSAALIAASVISLLLWGLRLGIDFTGGSLLEAEFKGERPQAEEIRAALAESGLSGAVIQPAGERGVILRFSAVEEETHQEILAALGELGEFTENRFDSIGPVVGGELKRRALLALGIAILAIVSFIAWAFRQVSPPPHQTFGMGAGPVASWKYGTVAIAALIHDILIPAGVFAFLGQVKNVEIDLFFAAALLTILGFSVHDTIVVFDRIRENLRGLKRPEPFEVTVNRSINQTLIRSINTSLTTLLVLAAIFFFGAGNLRFFALALMLGVIFGTYSSIFVASPLLVIWQRFGLRRNDLTPKR